MCMCVCVCVCGVCVCVCVQTKQSVRGKVLKSDVDLPRTSELNVSYHLQHLTQCCLDKYEHASKWPPYYTHTHTAVQ